MSAWTEIKELHRKSTAGAKEGIAFRYFSRPIASFILFHIQNGRITPNQVTILSLLVGVVGTAIHATWLSWGGLLCGGAMFMLAHMLDALDGQLARHRKAGSVVGMYFDFFIDGVKAFLMFAALAIRGFRLAALEEGGVRTVGDAPFGGDWASPTRLMNMVAAKVSDLGLLPSGAAASSFVLLLALVGLVGLAVGVACTDFLKKKEWKEAFPPKEGGAKGGGGPIGLVMKLGHFIVDYPSYILILCVLNRTDVYLLAYSIVVCAYAVQALTGISLKLWRVNPYAPK